MCLLEDQLFLIVAFAELAIGSRFKLDIDGPVLVRLPSRPNDRYNACVLGSTDAVRASHTGWLEIGEFRQVIRL